MAYTEWLCGIVVSLPGFSIGLKRQLTGRQAGIRINVLICMGTSFSPSPPCCMARPRFFRWPARGNTRFLHPPP